MIKLGNRIILQDSPQQRVEDQAQGYASAVSGPMADKRPMRDVSEKMYASRMGACYAGGKLQLQLSG